MPNKDKEKDQVIHILEEAKKLIKTNKAISVCSAINQTTYKLPANSDLKERMTASIMKSLNGKQSVALWLIDQGPHIVNDIRALQIKNAVGSTFKKYRLRWLDHLIQNPDEVIYSEGSSNAC